MEEERALRRDQPDFWRGDLIRLRTENEQLRTKEEQLRKKKEQLRSKDERLRSNSPDRSDQGLDNISVFAKRRKLCAQRIRLESSANETEKFKLK